jgi:arylsulfatase B
MKGSFYDGGHRVPFFLRWPAGGMTGGRDVAEMCLDIDLLPTFIELCGLPEPAEADFDGASVAPLLRGEAAGLGGDRVHFLKNRQGTEVPPMWVGAAMTRRWRLVGGEELYDIEADPGQRHDVAAEHPDVVQRLRGAWEEWYAGIEPHIHEYCPIVIGHDAENPMRLDAMDVMGDVAWHQTHICQAQKSSGTWTVEVAEKGTYIVRLCRWPEELGLAIDACVSPEEARRHIYAPPEGTCVTVQPAGARLAVGDQEWRCEVEPGRKEVTFEVELEPGGTTTLDAWFQDPDGEERGAYYVYIERR